MRIRTSLALTALLLVACGGGSSSNPSSGTSTTPPSSTAPTITTQPGSQSVTVGQTATFSVIGAGTAPLSYQWQTNGTAITGATASSYTTAATTLADNGSTFKVTVSNAVGTITSAAATLTVSATAAAGTDVLTYHNDNSRSAQNLTETVLTPANVNATQFGLLRVLPADGLVDGQPLIASNLSVSGVPNGTVYVVAMSKNAAGAYFQRLHALDLVTLAERPNSPVVIQATYPGT